MSFERTTHIEVVVLVGSRSPLRREQVRAATLLGVPLVVALLLWVVALGRDDPTARQASDPLSPAQEQGDADAAAPDDDPPDDDPPEGDPSEGDGDGADGPADAAPDDEPRTVDFDGVCEVEVDPAEADDDLRPWQFPACERAPIALDGGERWIVVIASLAGDDFTEGQALGRLERDGGDHVLWSSHYPSLNPDLWVVAAGPYDSEDEAAEVSRRLGSGAYPRELADDPGARYCIAADGCVGERR